MSAADIGERNWDVRFVPKADIAEHGRRHGKPEHLGSLARLTTSSNFVSC
jgi:hypothetical protein